jgi:hypothetical protein
VDERTLHHLVTRCPATSSIARLVRHRQVILVTPELAQDWLVAGGRGHTIEIPMPSERPGLVADYVAVMAAGYLVSVPGAGDLIRRDEHGQLSDGAHRLKAIVLSGPAIETWVETWAWEVAR